MKVRNLHEWNVEPSCALEIQRSLRPKISLRDAASLRAPRWIAGADACYSKIDKRIWGAVVLLSFPGLRLVEQKWVQAEVFFPYISGLLSFREAPVLLEVFSLLTRRPDVVIFDAQGIAHPRGLGLASHAALFLNLPAVGCAKSLFIGEFDEVGADRGAFSWLRHNGKRIGTVVRTRTNVKPVFVSPGHRVSFKTATRLVLASCRGYRLPEPVRLAHQLVHRAQRGDG